jgi:hypothetical protein
MDNYSMYRGKCREMSEAAVAENSNLRLVRGYYWCPVLNTKNPHWWTVDGDGVIFDPTRLQFPSAGIGTYEEFNGFVTCAECGVEVSENEAVTEGNYTCCSYRCMCALVGIRYTAPEVGA